MWSLCMQTGLAIPLRGTHQLHSHQQGMMEGGLCLCTFGNARERCVETALNTSSRQRPETRCCFQPRRVSRAGFSPFPTLPVSRGACFLHSLLQDWVPLS